MIPLRDNIRNSNLPIVTYTILVLNVIVFFWDRGGQWGLINSQGYVFSDVALVPAKIVGFVRGGGTGLDLAPLFTSLFMHGNIAHLVGNAVFLLAFGDNVENALGPWKFAMYYLFWGIAASFTHVYVMPGSMVPMIGASGAIGGILGCYFLLYPGSKVSFTIFPVIWMNFVLPAYFLLGAWFAFQIIFPQQGVANWAHVGGFLAGMVTVLVMGGRDRALKGVKLTPDLDDEFA
jgi:membrane associated rhomboid family serine protease